MSILYSMKNLPKSLCPLFLVLLLISIIISLILNKMKNKTEKEFPLIFDSNKIEIFAKLENKKDQIVGELPKAPWE